jgi:hypothetical protein
VAVAFSFTLTSCTPAQVKAWFWTQKHHHITNRQAQTIARLSNLPPAPAPPVTDPPTTAPIASNCDPNYTGQCVPTGVPDVNCSQLTGPVTVVGIDIYGLDSDGDGIGCESS